MLRTPEERLRLVEEIPEVIPDISDEAKVDGSSNLQGVNKGCHAYCFPSSIFYEGIYNHLEIVMLIAFHQTFSLREYIIT